MISSLSGLGAVVLLASLTSAQTPPNYYVSNGGSDTNQGSIQAPWATLGRVRQHADDPTKGFAAGDSINLERGSSWTDELLILPNPSPTANSNSGTSGSKIRLQAYGVGPAPVIKGLVQRVGTRVQLRNVEHWIISGLRFETSHHGVLLSNSTTPHTVLHGVEVHNCYFKDMDDRGNSFTNCGILIHGSAQQVDWQDISISNCIFDTVSNGVSNVGSTNNISIVDCAAFGGLSAGFSLTHVAGGTVAGFSVRDVGGTSSFGSCGAALILCDDVIVTDCSISGVRHDGGLDGVGFDFEAGCRNCTLRRSYIFNNEGAGIMVMSGNTLPLQHNSSLVIEDCLLYNNNTRYQLPGAPGFPAVNSELLCFHALNNGVMRNVGVYRRTTTTATYNHFSTNWGGFTIEPSVITGDYCVGWKPVYGKFSQLDVGGNGNIVGVEAGKVLVWTREFLGNCWTNVTGNFGPFLSASIGCDGVLWAVKNDFSVWGYDGGFNWSTRGTVAMKQISVGQLPPFTPPPTVMEDNVWGIDTQSTPQTWRWNQSLLPTPAWEWVSGNTTQVDAAATRGEGAWAVFASQQPPLVYRIQNPPTQTWQQVTTQPLDQVSSTNFNAAVGVYGNAVWLTRDGGVSWSQLPGQLTQVAEGSDGALWGLDANGHVWRFN
ncbi:MAG TPA: tectonin domain-containing protein [Planctomycetota bacterium]|nr:tectonin domain-containing protein [Planctomycetota bacterium]